MTYLAIFGGVVVVFLALLGLLAIISGLAFAFQTVMRDKP